MTARISSAWELLEGKCEEVLATMPSESVDSIVTDPPYGIRFMGKAWDGADIEAEVEKRRNFASAPANPASKNGGYRSKAAEAGRYDRSTVANRAFEEWCEVWGRECLRVLKPGGYLLAFGSPRTYHRMASGLENAGFTIRDSIHWFFGSGFPKSLNIAKQSPELAEEWDGYGTALKPAHEPIVVAQKPLSGTYAANVIEWGVGALNIDGCRVATADDCSRATGRGAFGLINDDGWVPTLDRTAGSPLGRWPTNLVFTHSADCGEECAADCPVTLLDRQSGTSGNNWRANKGTINAGQMAGLAGGSPNGGGSRGAAGHNDSGGASRFYPTFRYTDEDFAPFLYCAKPGKTERNAGLASLPIVTAAEMAGRKEGSAGLSNPRAGTRTRTGAANHHPTVKPIALMRWLVRLVTPHDGTTLDIFGGSGTTVAAAIREGKRAIAIEMTPEYWPIIRARAAHHEEAARIEAEERQAEAEREARRGRQMTIFDVLPATVEPERVEFRCWTCRGVFECERDETTGEMVCHGCRGEKHRRHHAAWLARIMAEYQEGEDDGIDF